MFIDKELVEERKSLCSGSFFCKIIGYNRGWLCQTEAGKRSVSERFIREYTEGLKKVRELLKK